MREMTCEQVVRLIREQAAACGTLRALCRRQGVHISTLSNMLHGRNPFTPRVLRLLGLAHVRIVARVEGVEAETLLVPQRPYRRMWRLGDWPSRYRVTGEL